MKTSLIDTFPDSLKQSICEHFGIQADDRAGLAACCSAMLGLQNSWNSGTEDPSGYLEKCFNDEVDSPFYARHKNPEGIELEQAYAEHHGAKHCLACSSGEAAISLVTQTLTKAGDTILVSERLFGTSQKNFRVSAAQDGREVIFTALHDFDKWSALISQHKPKMIFLESPSNPLAELADVPRFAQLLAAYDTYLVVDSTYAPASIYKPLSLGAHVLIESATKFIDGQTRVTGGLIVTNDSTINDALFSIRNAKGFNQVSFNALSLLYNLRSLEQRIITQSQHALEIAQALTQLPLLEEVSYLGLDDHRNHHIAKRDLLNNCFGSMISFRVKGDLKQTQAVANATGFDVRANLGSVKNIITHPITTTHSRSRLSDSDIQAAGVSDNLLRLSVGMEPPGHTIQALTMALSKILSKP